MVGNIQDVSHFVGTCESCQMHLNIRHRDQLQPTYPLTIYFKWMVDLVSMSMELGQMKYLVLAREDLTNQVDDVNLEVTRRHLCGSVCVCADLSSYMQQTTQILNREREIDTTQTLMQSFALYFFR